MINRYSMGWIPDYPDFRDYTEETNEVKEILKPSASCDNVLNRVKTYLATGQFQI